jgi:hypothetical protein
MGVRPCCGPPSRLHPVSRFTQPDMDIVRSWSQVFASFMLFPCFRTLFPRVLFATPCATLWTLLCFSYLAYFLILSFTIYTLLYFCLKLKQFTPPLYPEPCDRACDCDCETATATLRSPSPRPSFTTANYTALLRLSLRLLRTLHLFISSSLNPATPSLLVDCDRDSATATATTYLPRPFDSSRPLRYVYRGSLLLRIFASSNFAI